MKLFEFRVPEFIKDDFYRKLISIFFACLIWYFVHQHVSEVETFKNVKVDVIAKSTGQVFVSNYKPEISVKLRGPREILNDLESKDIQVSIDVKELLRPGPNEIRVLREHIKLPENLKVEAIITKTINVNVDTIVEKEVEVKIRYTNRLSDKYALLREPTVKPETVIITGPSRKLEKINFIDTRPIYIDPSRTTDFSVTTKVVPPEGVNLNYDNVTAYVELKKRIEFKSLSVQRVYVLHTGDTKTPVSAAAVGQAFAYVSGPPKVLKDLDIDKDVKLFIEIVDPKIRTYEIQFWCRDPGVTKVKITPSRVTLSDLPPEE